MNNAAVARVLAAVAVVVVFVAGLVAVSVHMSSSSGVVLYGDSISSQSVRELRHAWAPPLDVRAVPGARTAQILAAARRDGGHPEMVVVELGTNDIDFDVPVDRIMANLTEFGEVFPNANCVVYVNVSTGVFMRGRAHVADVRGLNQRLDDLGRSHPRVRVVDWDAVVRGADKKDQPILVDTVHPNRVGRRLLAGAIGAALKTC